MNLLVVILVAVSCGSGVVLASDKEGQQKHHSHQLSKSKKGISELRKELKSSKDESQKFHLQSEIVRHYASAKLNAKNQVEAQDMSESLLKMAESFKGDWAYGNALHHAHLVLGRLKLGKGDADGAVNDLTLAGTTPGSPQLNSFGPNMTLAKELLEKGHKEAVLNYLNECLKFWSSESAKSQVESWKVTIQEGKIPEFKAHLTY